MLFMAFIKVPIMKTLAIFILISIFIISCNSTANTILTNNEILPDEAVMITNDSL